MTVELSAFEKRKRRAERLGDVIARMNTISYQRAAEEISGAKYELLLRRYGGEKSNLERKLGMREKKSTPSDGDSWRKDQPMV